MIDKLIASVHSNKYFDKSFEVSWLKSYKHSQYYNNTSSSAFKSGLQDFFSDPQYAVFSNDVVIDYNNASISASRVYVRSSNLENSQEEGKMMLESRDIANAASIDCFAYSPAFIVSELYVRILGLTLQSVGIALAAVFVITCIFMPHPVLIVFVTLAVASIMTGVVGFMLYLNVSLSAISMLMLIMSIGFSVDFTAHICHGYMISDAETRALRVRQAIDKTGAPIFHGAVSSLFGILVLIGAKSYIFRSFAAVMSFVLLFGITHALFLLPVILSWFGPGRMNKVDRNSKLRSLTNIAYTNDNNEEKT
ncbi:patched domain-containing protein 3-like isoform X1 [Mercenaria mercenaria]|uniref:patched domain-containing protein 3-like isoform X1 n=1 Tax=Mercenaria mercenaria TaxID=6596 RepID=UPI00234EF63E|nr:patched domain-containing protein 3-like isoform X1 [Mercenaria mercenaria]